MQHFGALGAACLGVNGEEPEDRPQLLRLCVVALHCAYAAIKSFSYKGCDVVLLWWIAAMIDNTNSTTVQGLMPTSNTVESGGGADEAKLNNCKKISLIG
jgi:hypothetical protein